MIATRRPNALPLERWGRNLLEQVQVRADRSWLGRHAFEFRHPSWFEGDEALELLRWHGVALAIGDHPQRPWQPWVTTADWTFATNDVDVAIARGDCTFDQFEAAQCEILAMTISTTTKPERASVPSAAVGTYTLFVANFGPTAESISYQIVLTPSATGS